MDGCIRWEIGQGEWANLGRLCAASHCNQWEFCGICAKMREPIELPFGVMSGMAQSLVY